MEAEPTEGKVPQAKGGEAVVTFFTKLPSKYQVQEESLVVPANLARYGLSEIVNQLLGLDKPVPFDFVVDGEFLRSDLFGYLEARKLSSEKVLRLEYVLALSEPEENQVDEVPDWISSIVALGPLPSRWFAVSAFDGSVRLYEDGAPKLTSRLADVSITMLHALPAGSVADESLIAASGKDGGLRAIRARQGASPATGPVTTIRSSSHFDGLQACALNEKADLVAGAGWDQDILVWNAGPSLFAPIGEDQGGTKRKAADGSAESEEPKFVLKGHSQVVTSLMFGSASRCPFTLISGSWDGSVRVWDTAAASCVCNWPVARAATSFSMSPSTPQLATAHEDGHISLWDIRAPPHPTVQGALSLDSSAGLPLHSAQSPHRRLASQVQWSPLDANRLASCGHDGCLCVLDVRSPKMPLQRMRLGKTGPVPTKQLCLAWLGSEEIAVGGSDGKVLRVVLGGGKLPED